MIVTSTPLLDHFTDGEQRPLIIQDTFGGNIERDDVSNLDQLFVAFFEQSPKWIAPLMALRNQVVGRLGFETGSEMHGELPQHPMPGDAAGVFRVFGRSENELLLGNDDKHMSFRVSFALTDRQLAVSTVAYATTRIGQAYLRFISPFHRLVAGSMVKRVLTNEER